MVIIVPKIYPYDNWVKPFVVTEGLYKSIDGNFVVRIDDTEGKQIEPNITVEGRKFKLWKYRDWHGDWVVYETFHRT